MMPGLTCARALSVASASIRHFRTSAECRRRITDADATRHVFKQGLSQPKWDAGRDLPLPPRQSAIGPALPAKDSWRTESSVDGKRLWYAVTLKRSSIGMPQKTKDLLHSDLGFKRRLRTVFYPASPSIAGKILKVKELVQVEVLEKLPYGAQKTSGQKLGRHEVPRKLRNGGSPFRGFIAEGSVLPWRANRINDGVE
ncbi:hypothetical protein DFJ74DRAFT_227102 [Hyaloraphidium curvatum]|nr:hypothetical protein DFJ74DRAFT_227102 [Hyaloraphidium curvatum]